MLEDILCVRGQKMTIYLHSKSMTRRTRTSARTVRVPTTITSLLSTTERVARLSFEEESSREEDEEVAEDETGEPFLSFGFWSLFGYEGW